MWMYDDEEGSYPDGKVYLSKTKAELKLLEEQSKPNSEYKNIDGFGYWYVEEFDLDDEEDD